MIESEKTFRVDNIYFFIIFMIIIEHLMIYRMHFELSEVKLFVFLNPLLGGNIEKSHFKLELRLMK